MDAQVRKRLNMDVKVYPFIKRVDGDKSFGTAYILKGKITPKNTVIVDRDGVEIQVNTSVLLDGADADMIHSEDEIELPFLGRIAVKQIIPYVALVAGKYEILEVML